MNLCKESLITVLYFITKIHGQGTIQTAYKLIIHKLLLTTNKIINFITKSLRKFCSFFFLLQFWGLGFFCMLKTLVFDLHQVKVICYRHYLKPYINKEHYWTMSANWCITNLEMIQKSIFHEHAKKIVQYFVKKKFLCA